MAKRSRRFRAKNRFWEKKSEVDWNEQPARLQGAGHQLLSNQRGLRGSTFGPAGVGRRLSPEERAAIEEKMRKEGKI